jgi:flagellar biogenesis protein FliO
MQQAISFIEQCRGAWRRNMPWAKESTRRMKVVETLLLADRRSLVLVECEGQRLLLGSTPGSLNMIAELSPQGRHE